MPFLIGLFELVLPPVLSPLPQPLPAPLVEVRPPLLLLPLMALNGAVEVPMDPLLLRGFTVGLESWLGLL